MTKIKQFIYVISNPAWKDWYKIGKTQNPNLLLSRYNTSCPLKDYVLEYCLEVDNPDNHEDFFKDSKSNNDNGEWIKNKLEKIIYTIQILEFGSNKYSLFEGLQKRIGINKDKATKRKYNNNIKITVYTKKFID